MPVSNVNYSPSSGPQLSGVSLTDDLFAVMQWMEQELRTIAGAINETTLVDLRPVGAAPDKPRDGMVVNANGSTFNPGAGAGLYERKGGAWVKL